MRMPPHLVSAGYVQITQCWNRARGNEGSFVSWPYKLCDGEGALPDNYAPPVSTPIRIMVLENELCLRPFSGRIPGCSSGKFSAPLGPEVMGADGQWKHKAFDLLYQKRLPKVVLGYEWDQFSFVLSDHPRGETDTETVAGVAAATIPRQ